jgi:branched-chain amino acid transport system ATP-binding protein
LVVPSLLADVGEAAPEELVATAEVPAVAGSGEKLLRVSGLNVRYGGTQVLFGVDFDIAEGEIVALLGTNGAGKSTLLNAVSGVVSSFGGSVMFDGRDITNAPAHRVVARGVLQVPGGRGVFGSLTVEENLRIAGWLYRRDPAHVNEAIDEVLGYFPVLRERWSLPAANLSGGEQQMLTLGQAFIAKPRLLMIDELSLGLAPVVVERLLEIIKAIHDRGTTIVLVEQSVNVALTVAQTAYFMEKGQIRFHGATRELLQRPDILRSVFLEGAASIGTAGARTNGSKRSKHPIRAASRPAQTQRVLEVSRLRKAFGGITAVDDASFVLHEGEILGLIGPNGAGKTTIFDLISGFLRPDTGNVVLAGEDITDAPPDIRSRIGLGRSFQDARLFPALTVADTVALYLERHVEVKDPLAAALNLPTVADSEAAVSRRVNELIELMGLTAFRDKFLSELSTGSRRIVDLACILAHEPKVVLLDEPASGIAQKETEALGPLLLRIRDVTGASLLVIEHDMPLIGSISDRIVALDLGRVIAGGTPDEIVHHPAVVASYLGSSEQVVARPSKAGKSRKRQQTGPSVTR